MECRKPRHDRETNEEVNIAQIPDYESALLFVEYGEEDENMMLFKKEKVVPKLNQISGEK